MDNLALLASTLTGIFMAYMYYREWKLKKEKAPDERAANLSGAIEKLSTALGLTSNELVESLTDAAKLRDELEREREATAARIVETNQHRAEMDRKVEDLEREMGLLRRQVADGEARYREMEKKYANAKQAIEMLVQALKDAKLPIPPGLDTLLGDSIHGLKWPKGTE